MRRTAVLLAALALLPAARLGAQATAADSAAIRAAALDYVEGWYQGSGERMERALHPDLAKRIVMTNPQNGRSRLDQMSAMTLVQAARNGGGKDTPAAEQKKDVRILDIYQNAASVRAEMAGWVDYMHLGKTNGQWKIVNVLWALRPQEGQGSQGEAARR
jgi:hypothetical protein